VVALSRSAQSGFAVADDPGIAAKVLAIHRALQAANLPHAFGGALALAYCVPEPRTTSDVDVNVFVPAGEAQTVLDALPPDITFGADEKALLERDGQARLRWGRTPIDVFLSNDAFHDEVALAIRRVPMGEVTIPVLSCAHLAIFKTAFARGKDFIDIGNMVEGRSFNPREVRSTLAELLGDDAPELERFDEAVADGYDPERNEPKNRFPRR